MGCTKSLRKDRFERELGANGKRLGKVAAAGVAAGDRDWTEPETHAGADRDLDCRVRGRFQVHPLLPARIDGASMAPTYRSHGLTFINRLAYLFHEPRRGDVVAIATSGTSIMYMKRIIGLPGETISFHDGRAYINGQALPEPYVKGPCDWELAPEALGPNQYYFAGDNRSMPLAQHYQGRQYRDRIVGKLLL